MSPSTSTKTRKSTPRRKAAATPAKARRSPRARPGPRKAAAKPTKAARGKAKPRQRIAKTALAKPATARPARPQAPTRGGNVHAHCSATDPFGDACQNLPRRPSTYCVIHSYLDR